MRAGRFRLVRFVAWYRRLRRNPLDPGFMDGQFPRRFAWDVAWHWSQDEAAYYRRPDDAEAAMNPDPFRAPDTDIEPPPYVPEPIDHWDYVAIVVIAAACIAFGWWAFLR